MSSTQSALAEVPIPRAAEPRLEARELTKRYGGHLTLDRLSLTLEPGVALVGLARLARIRVEPGRRAEARQPVAAAGGAR